MTALGRPLAGAAANPTASETRLHAGIEERESPAAGNPAIKTAPVTTVGATMVPNLIAAAPRTGRVVPAAMESIPAMATDREGGTSAEVFERRRIRGCAAVQAAVTAAELTSPEPRRKVAESVPAPAGIQNPLPSTGIFIGNVPLHAHDSDFLKTLSYVNPSIQNGEIVVRPSIDVVRDGSRRWDNTAVGYFLGRKPYYHHLNDYVRSVWPAVKTVTATSNGFYFFQFKTEVAMEEVIEGGPWLFQGQPIVLQRWEPGMALRKHKHTQVPVWIRLRHLPVEFWTDDGLSTVASGVGRPLYPDNITRACTRLDFARVCVMLDISSTLPKHLIIMMPKEDGSEVPCKVEVEYEWCLRSAKLVCPSAIRRPHAPTPKKLRNRRLRCTYRSGICSHRLNSPLRPSILTVQFGR
ncbi:UNVERIFIED_CONTAM: hypothetical protein Sangu_3244300 [Sesamum angustifolium]|uniref:DUF4283 domain-containing protein n=1 Tax=Sesamum angustifolium TaxID=2727405 RepID=A0AAW2JGW7_9LAMI